MNHADHQWAREVLPAHVAGGLSAEERTRLEEHVASCAECIAELDALRRFETSMEQMFAPMRPQPGLEERVIRGLRTFPVQRQRPVALKVVYGLAAVFLFGLVGFAVMNVAEGGDPAGTVLEGLVSKAPPAGMDKAVAGSSYADDLRSKLQANSGVEESERRGGRLPSAGEMASMHGKRLAGKNRERSTDEPAIFFPEGKESDHNESADAERQMKGDSKDFRDYIKGEAGGFRGRQAGQGRPYDAPAAPSDPGKPAPAPPKAADGVFALRDDGAAGPSGRFQPEQEKAFRPGDLAEAKGKESNDSLKKTMEEPQRTNRIVAGGMKAPQAQAEGGPQAPPQQARKIIRSGDMEFEIESFDLAVTKIDAIAAEEQGVIATINSEKLPNGKVRGTVVVRVPPDRLGNLITKLRALGDLKSQRLGSEDITKQYTDLESRLRAARTMEERLIKIIKEGKGEIKDLLLAEKELGEWRTRIEVAEGEKRYYDNLVSLSTLTITLFEKEIRAAFGITETERVDAGVEVEEVEKAYKDLLAAVAEAKGRITKSDLRKLTAGQFSATVNFEVSPDVSGTLRDRLKQLGNVARLDVTTAQQTEGGKSPTPEVKVKRNDTQFFVSLYNLANVTPREIVHLNLACVDAEAAYKAVLQRVEKAAGRVKNSNLNRQKSDQSTGVVDFEVKAVEAEAVLSDLKALGEVMFLQVMENSDTANVTRSKRGYVVNVSALGTTQARETTVIQLAAKDVAAAYAALSEAVRKAEGRLFSANLNENDRRNVSATLSFDVRRDALKGVDEALKAAGEIYTRASNRMQDAQNVVDSKVRIDLTLFPVANVPPRETVRLAIEVDKVDASVEALQAIVSEYKGRVLDSQRSRENDGRHVSRLVVDVPFKDSRAVAQRMKALGMTRVDEARPNTAVPEGELAVARFDVTLSNEVIVPADSAPWASIKKGFSYSALALSWALSLIMVGICFILPIGGIVWGVWKVSKRVKHQPPAAPTA
jgi:uncharacterized protein DUF4349/putative zinc finger protein